MPGPDPNRLWIEDSRPHSPLVLWQAYDRTGNAGNRRARALAILRRLRLGTWCCRCCGDDLPDHLRADAVYCGESCRKRGARSRKANRGW